MNTTTMPITKARINLGGVVEDIRTTGSSVVLEKGGIPVAAVVAMDWFEDVQDALQLAKLRWEQRNEKGGTTLKQLRKKYDL